MSSAIFFFVVLRLFWRDLSVPLLDLFRDTFLGFETIANVIVPDFFLIYPWHRGRMQGLVYFVSCQFAESVY